MQTELRIDITARFVNDILKSSHLLQSIQVHHMKWQEAYSLSIVECSNDQRAPRANLDFKKPDITRSLNMSDLLVIFPTLGHLPVNYDFD